MSEWWRSSFKLPDGGTSYSEMWATKTEADQIARTRGFDPPKKYRGMVREFRPSILAMLPGGLLRPDVFHSTCYIAFLAARSQVVSAEQLVCDGSPLHELSHYHHGGPNTRGGKQMDRTIEALRWLEDITPGIPPHELLLMPPAIMRTTYATTFNPTP